MRKYLTTALLKARDFPGRARDAPLALAAAGALSLLAYFVSTFLSIFIPGADWSHFPPYLALPEGGFALSSYYLIYALISLNALALFGLYFFALKVAGNPAPEIAGQPSAGWRRLARSRAGLIFIFSLLFHLAMMATPILLSTDIFDYIRHGRIFTLYQENPLTVPATYFPQDPFFDLGGWVGTGSVYGPLHVYITGALAWAAGNGISANFLLFKAFFVGLDLLNLVLIWKIASRIRPGLENKAMLFYGWNPFILVLVVANAHNDILMLTLVLGGILCYLDRRFLLGVLCITFATLVKFMALPILLVYIALAVKKQGSLAKRLAMGAGAGALAGLVTALSYLPLWEGRETFYYLTTVGQKTNFTMPSLIRDFAAGHLQLPLSGTIVQISLAAALAAYLVWHLAGVKNTEGLISAASGLAFLTPLVLFWFQPWYLTLVLGLVALRPWRLMYRVTLLFSFTVMFFDSFWWHTPISMDIQKPLRVAVVFGLPVAFLLALKIKEVIPGAFEKMIAWSLSENGSGGPARRNITDPAAATVAAEITTLVAAAAVPMAVIITASPRLKSLVDLVVLKLQLITRL